MKTFVADFETTTYEGQTRTDVWSSACVELYTEDVYIFGDIKTQWEFFKSLNESVVVYYHNLKFDGNFWLHFFLTQTKLKHAVNIDTTNINNTRFLDLKDMPTNSFSYNISRLGQWYTITVKLCNRTIIFKDSLKLLPFSLNRIGKSFETKHKKLTMEYTGYRYPNCPITDEEKEYIRNDVLVLKEALEIMFDEGHNKLTIGSCCMHEFNKTVGDMKERETLFPDLQKINVKYELYNPISCYQTGRFIKPKINEKLEKITAEQYIRKSYKGGWCYLVEGKESKIHNNGLTADVNSLYPSMMSSESGNYYPVGRPTFWYGNYIPSILSNKTRYYYFVRIKTRFYIKENYLPTIQIKRNLLYPSNKWLTTSDVYDKETKKYYSTLLDYDNKELDTRVTMTLTQTDFELIKEHYNLVDFEIIDGCYFSAEKGIFDEYIEKYKKIKLESKGAKRELAKLFLNNLYGKMATSPDSSFKVAFIKDDKSVGYFDVCVYDKKAGYIAIGSAITSYARNFTIRTAQKNYYGKNKRGFIYADTDSIHCDLSPNEIIGVKIHDKNFCCWKLESEWDNAIFVRQKTYIEHIIKEDGERITPKYCVKCAGMPEICKQKLINNFEQNIPENISNEDKKFYARKLTLNDFKIGLKIYGKLLPKRIEGGVVLQETTFEMR